MLKKASKIEIFWFIWFYMEIFLFYPIIMAEYSIL